MRRRRAFERESAERFYCCRALSRRVASGNERDRRRPPATRPSRTRQGRVARASASRSTTSVRNRRRELRQARGRRHARARSSASRLSAAVPSRARRGASRRSLARGGRAVPHPPDTNTALLSSCDPIRRSRSRCAFARFIHFRRYLSARERRSLGLFLKIVTAYSSASSARAKPLSFWSTVPI